MGEIIMMSECVYAVSMCMCLATLSDDTNMVLQWCLEMTITPGARPPAPGGRGGFQGRGAQAPPAQGPAPGRGRGHYQGGRGPQSTPGQPKPAAVPSSVPVPKEDFDFESNLEKFNKEEVAKVCICVAAVLTLMVQTILPKYCTVHMHLAFMVQC